MRMIFTTILGLIALYSSGVSGEATPERHEFQAEMNRLMDIIINSLYNDKEVFLRELVSNAHDAVEKARFLSLSDPDYLHGDNDLEIRIEVDEASKTLTITDTGVGMTKADLINNLGTVAKSGTTNFIEKMSESGSTDSSLIGQFGVGFYSAFLVADKVSVASKNNADSKQYVWESNAASSFTISEDNSGEPLVRGTRITLHLKDDAQEYLSSDKMKDLVKKFSQFIPFPIKVKTERDVTEEVPLDEADEDDEDLSDLEVEESTEGDDEEEKPKTKTIHKTVVEWDHVNTAKPLWMRPKDNITEEDYEEFYKAISREYRAPLAYTHFSAEGNTEFSSILFIPATAPRDMMDNYWKKKNEIKLYVRRVLVADNLDELLPAYLGFVRGMVDSNDLPLNVNRDQLQQSRIMRVISKKLVKKVLDLLRDLAKESDNEDTVADEEDDEDSDAPRVRKERKEGDLSDWDKFYGQYSTQLKLGCYEDDGNRNRVAKLLRFNTWKSPDALVSLDKYIKDAPEDQKFIYYMSGDSAELMSKAPVLQAFKKRDIDVLLFSNNLDEPCIQRLADYGDRKLVSIQKTDIKLPETEEEKNRFKKLKKMYKPLTTWMKDNISTAGVKIESVVLSKRLVDSPCVVVASQYGQSAQQERVMKSQAYQDKDMSGMMSGKTLEINPNHPIIVDLLEKVNADKEDAQAMDIATVVFQAALLDSGFELSDPSALVARMYKLMSVQLGVDPEAQVTDVAVPEDDVDEESIKDEDAEEMDFDMGAFDDFDMDDAEFGRDEL